MVADRLGPDSLSALPGLGLFSLFQGGGEVPLQLRLEEECRALIRQINTKQTENKKFVIPVPEPVLTAQKQSNKF